MFMPKEERMSRLQKLLVRYEEYDKAEKDGRDFDTDTFFTDLHLLYDDIDDHLMEYFQEALDMPAEEVQRMLNTNDTCRTDEEDLWWCIVTGKVAGHPGYQDEFSDTVRDSIRILMEARAGKLNVDNRNPVPIKDLNFEPFMTDSQKTAIERLKELSYVKD